MQPSSAEALYQQAREWHQRGDAAQAEPLYQAAITADSSYLPPLNNLAVLYLAQGRFDDAIGLLEQALTLAATSVDVLTNLGIAHTQTKQFERAIGYLQQAGEHDPERPDIFYNLAQAQLQSGAIQDGLHTLQGLMGKQPTYVHAFISYAQTSAQLGHVADGIRVLEMLLEREPNQLDGMIQLAELHYAQNNPQAAADLYQRANRLYPNNPPLMTSYGRLLCAQGATEQGLDYLKQAVALQPDNWILQSHYGDALREAGQLEAAIEAYQAANRLNPGQVRVRRNLARTLARFVPAWHLTMLADEERNGAYRAAIERAVTNQSVVLDIGTGSGLLSMMAARAGAKQVYTCEQTRHVAEAATTIIAQNGFSERIDVINQLSTKLADDHFNPKPNLLVAEVFDAGLIGEQAIATFRHALEHLCAPDCTVIPARAQLRARLLECPELASVNPVRDVEGFDLSHFDLFRSPAEYISQDLKQVKHRFLSATFDLQAYDFKQLHSQVSADHSLVMPLTVDASAAGTLHGVAIWFDLWLDEDTLLTTEPARGNNHWGQALYFFDQPMAVQAGQRLHLPLHYNDHRLWFDTPVVQP